MVNQVKDKPKESPGGPERGKRVARRPPRWPRKRAAGARRDGAEQFALGLAEGTRPAMVTGWFAPSPGAPSASSGRARCRAGAGSWPCRSNLARDHVALALELEDGEHAAPITNQGLEPVAVRVDASGGARSRRQDDGVDAPGRAAREASASAASRRSSATRRSQSSVFLGGRIPRGLRDAGSRRRQG